MKKIISICCMLIAIILMSLPHGVSMTFAPSPTERVTRYFSYFSMMPVGYANWFPIITALLTILILFLILIGIKIVNTRRTVQVCLGLCLIASAFSFLVFNSASIVGICVAALHIIVFVLEIPHKPNLKK